MSRVFASPLHFQQSLDAQLRQEADATTRCRAYVTLG